MRTPTKGDDSGDPKAGGCRVVRLNVLGVPYASHAAVHHLLDRVSGDVVIVSSLAGRRVPKADGTVYAATNYALTVVAKGLRMDVSARGVRVINVEPGLVRTEFPEGSFRSADQYYAEKEYSTIEGKDVGAAVLYAVEHPHALASARSWSALQNSSNNRSAFGPFGYAVMRDDRPRKSAPTVE